MIKVSINVENQNRVLEGSLPRLELNVSLDTRDKGPHLPRSCPSLSCPFRAFPSCSRASCQSLVPVRGGAFGPSPLSAPSCQDPQSVRCPQTHRRPRLTWRWHGADWRQGGRMSGALESWAAGRTLGHGCPSWTLLCHLAAAICNCDNLALPRSTDPAGHFQVSDSDPGLPCSPQPGRHCPPTANRG